MVSAPTPPAGLLKPARDRWAAFWASPAAEQVQLGSDLPRLLRWVQQTDEYDRVARNVRKAHLVRGSMGQPVANPLIGYLATLDAAICRTETEFGMTPAARQRLKVDPPKLERQEDEIDELRARRARRRASG
jgi:P27 family predicted phage terminase small subunit